MIEVVMAAEDLQMTKMVHDHIQHVVHIMEREQLTRDERAWLEILQLMAQSLMDLNQPVPDGW